MKARGRAGYISAEGDLWILELLAHLTEVIRNVVEVHGFGVEHTQDRLFRDTELEL